MTSFDMHTIFSYGMSNMKSNEKNNDSKRIKIVKCNDFSSFFTLNVNKNKPFSMMPGMMMIEATINTRPTT